MRIMIPKVEINSISFSRSKNDQSDFVKYNIEVALDEMESTDTDVKLKYGLTLLSDPKNVRINAEGITTIIGDQAQTSKYMGQDENNIPNILNIIYQELFPLFHLLSKSMQIPCPAYKLSQVASSIKSSDTSSQVKSETLPELEGIDTTQNSNVETQSDVIKMEEQPTEKVL